MEVAYKFDEERWIAAVDTVTVHSEREVTFTFKDDSKININFCENNMTNIYDACGVTEKPCRLFFVYNKYKEYIHTVVN